MVSKEELVNIAVRALETLLSYYKSGRIDKYLSEALGVSAKVSVVGGAPIIEEITLTRTTGGPNTYVRLYPDRIEVEVWWGFEKYSLTYDRREAKEIFNELEETVKEMLRATFC